MRAPCGGDQGDEGFHLRHHSSAVEYGLHKSASARRCCCPLVDVDVSVVFYDLTTVGVEGEEVVDDDVRHRGMCKESFVARKVTL